MLSSVNAGLLRAAIGAASVCPESISKGTGLHSLRHYFPTRLILDGAKAEQPFKDYLRRHQLPTQVWYTAAPGVTAYDMQRNSLIRNGLEQSTISDSELDDWIKLL